MTTPVLLEIDNAIAKITLNRPQHMNAYDNHMGDALAAITTDVMLNKQVRAVVIQGAGDLFMAGGDIRFFHQHLDEMPRAVLPIMRTLNTAILNLRNMQKPTLACVHGAVAGVGISLMLACDLVLAADNTKFTTAYNKIGLSPDGGASYFLPRVVGTKQAMELFLLSDTFDATRAQQLGLLNWVVSTTELFATRDKILERLAQSATHALRATRNLVNQSFENDLTQQLEAEVSGFMSCTTTHDFRVGVNAFVNKTKPQFEGK